MTTTFKTLVLKIDYKENGFVQPCITSTFLVILEIQTPNWVEMMMNLLKKSEEKKSIKFHIKWESTCFRRLLWTTFNLTDRRPTVSQIGYRGNTLAFSGIIWFPSMEVSNRIKSKTKVKFQTWHPQKLVFCLHLKRFYSPFNIQMILVMKTMCRVKTLWITWK